MGEIPTAKWAREIRITVAATVRQLREQRGYSQESLAATCLLSRSVIARLEQGRHEPRLSTLLLIAEALEVPPSAFVDALAAGVKSPPHLDAKHA
jgi:transcriptional regulator with XRE-family HTH domain